MMLVTLAAIVAVAAAIRSTWSPCGLSMLSTITPMAERSRGRRWGLTATWFVLGAVLGGATLGLLAVLGAVVVGAVGLSSTVALGVAAVLALVAAGMDLGIGTEMPHHRRQVDEVWLDQYRSWVYGLGFGWQIGSGLSTYIMTAAVYLTIALAALTGSPATAMAHRPALRPDAWPGDPDGRPSDRSRATAALPPALRRARADGALGRHRRADVGRRRGRRGCVRAARRAGCSCSGGCRGTRDPWRGRRCSGSAGCAARTPLRHTHSRPNRSGPNRSAEPVGALLGTAAGT